ncbi:MAG: hypothetical protein R2877_00920 [Bdellovibrionota bacterium]
MKFLRLSLFLSLFALMVSCDGSKTDDPQRPEETDPLELIYGNYLSKCIDFGGGPRNQLFANLNSNGDLETVVLTWSLDDCEGVYSLSNFNGDPLIGPEHMQDFEHFEVEGVPANFFVVKIRNVDASGTTYAIFNKSGSKLHVLSDISTFPDTWEEALENDEIAEFADDPATATPATYGILHFNKGEMPDPIAALYKNWLSNCVNFGGGEVNQVFATFDDNQPLTANLTWSDPGCMGTYDLFDVLNNPIAQPTHSQNIQHRPVLGIPLGMFVLKVTTISTNDVVYVLIHYNSVTDEFYELVPFAQNHANWSDWLLEDDVSDFADDPAAAMPGSHIKFHFTNSDLP